MSGYVQTVRGRIGPEQLGATYSHEHLAAHATPELAARDPDLVLDDPMRINADLAAFRAAGGSTIVELTTVDYGRDPNMLLALSKMSDVQIIAATGFNKGTYCRRFTEAADPAFLAERMIVELRDGIDGTNIRPGIIKAASSLDRIEPWEEVAFRAAARAHLATGRQVITHTEHGSMAEEQVALLCSEGVRPEHIILSHMDHRPDLGLHRRLAETGVFLSYDQIPKPKYRTEGTALKLIVALAQLGLHRQILIGGDFARRSYFWGWGGAPGLDYLLNHFRARLTACLEEAGLPVTPVIDAIFVQNPARALACME
jgi:phosphotriesterase-related protein